MLSADYYISEDRQIALKKKFLKNKKEEGKLSFYLPFKWKSFALPFFFLFGAYRREREEAIGEQMREIQHLPTNVCSVTIKMSWKCIYLETLYFGRPNI